MIKVTVPATTANLGPGFDCMGIALQIRNTIIVEESDKKLEIICHDRQSKYIEKNKSNLIYKSIKTVFDLSGKRLSGLSLNLINEIPACRGLGSSAACIAAGCAIGNALSQSNLSINELIDIGAQIEGHPDNIVPAFIGGFAISCIENKKVIYHNSKPHSNFVFSVMSPSFTLPTIESRKVLPDLLTRQDAVFNISRASLMTAALISGDVELLMHSCKDKLHQPYRKKLIPDFDFIAEKAKQGRAYATFLSGAGPTIIAVLDKTNESFTRFMEQHLFELKNGWTIKTIEASCEGLEINV